MNERYAAWAVKVVQAEDLRPPPPLSLQRLLGFFSQLFNVLHSVMEGNKLYLLKYFHFRRLQRQP